MVFVLRATVFSGLVAALFAASPAAALGEEAPDCARVVFAETTAEHASVDLYVTEVVDYETDVTSVDPTALILGILEGRDHGERPTSHPGEVGDGEFVVQLEVLLAGSDEPELTGMRMTYQVSVLDCLSP